MKIIRVVISFKDGKIIVKEFHKKKDLKSDLLEHLNILIKDGNVKKITIESSKGL